MYGLIPMGNRAFALRSVVWPRQLNSGVKHHGKRFDSGVRTANEEVQLGGDRVRDRGLNDIVQFMAIFAITLRARNLSFDAPLTNVPNLMRCRRGRDLLMVMRYRWGKGQRVMA